MRDVLEFWIQCRCSKWPPSASKHCRSRRTATRVYTFFWATLYIYIYIYIYIYVCVCVCVYRGCQKCIHILRDVIYVKYVYIFWRPPYIYIIHYNPQHVSSSTLLILRRTNCIITASGNVTLCKRPYSMPVESGLQSALNRHMYCYRINEVCIKLVT